MADTNTIIQKITIEGGKEIEAALKSMGKTGEEAFQKINTAANDTKASAGGVESLAKSTAGAGATAQNATGEFSKMRSALDLFGSTSKEAGRDAKGLSQSAADAISGMKGFSASSDQAGASAGATDVSLIRFAQTLRLLSRATGEHELGQFARTLGLLGRAAQLVSPALFVAFSEKVAASAAKATDQVAEFAAKNKVSFDRFQEFGGQFTAVGLGAEDASKTFGAFTSIIKESVANTDKNTLEFAKFNVQIEESQFKLRELGKAFTDLNRESFRTMRDLANEQRDFTREQSIASSDFIKSSKSIAQQISDLESGKKIGPQEQKERQLATLREQQAKLSEAESHRILKSLEDQVKLTEKKEDAVRKQREEEFKLLKQQRDEERVLKEQKAAFEKSRVEAERTATVFQKLGIATELLDKDNKLKKTDEALLVFADALSNVTDKEKQEKLANEAIADGLAQHLIPTYLKGADAVRALNKEGLKIRPKILDSEKESAANFTIAIGQAESAIGTLRNILGIAVAPAFTAFFKRLTTIFVELQPSIRQFGDLIGKFLTPLLDGLATALEILIGGIGGTLNAFGTLFNSVFGTNLTTVQVFAGVLLAIALIFGGLPTRVILASAAIGLFFDKISQTFGLGEFGKTVLKTITFVSLAFALFGARIIGIFIGIRLFITAVFGSLFTFAPLFAIIGVAALAFFAIWKNWDVIKGPALKAFNAVSDYAKNFWETLKVGFNNLMEGLGKLWDKLVGPAQQAFDGIVSVFNNVLGPAFEGIKKGFNDLVDSINEATGKKFTPTTIAIGVIIGLLVALAFAFAPVTTAITAIILVGGFLANMWKDNQAALILLGIAVAALLLLFAPWTVIIGLVATAVGLVILKWDDLKKAGKAAVDFLKAKWEEFAKWFTDSWVWRILTGIGSLIAKFAELIGIKNKAVANNSSDPLGGPRTGLLDIPDQPGLEPKLAGGGSVWGRGTSTSDSIPAWLSDGEFVTQTKAVNYYGRTFMHALNKMLIPKDMFRGFNMGGLAESMSSFMPGALKFASGGSVRAQALHPVHLHLPNGQVISGLQANDGVVKNLVRASVARQISSTGRKPSYLGRGRV